jgi:hypothetical protein
VENLFGGLGWHSYCELKRKDKKKICYWCKEPEEKKALVNIWGSVYSVGACNKCYPNHHGKARDDL